MEWFYAINKQQHGPVSAEQLTELVRQGTVLGSTLVWHKGMTDWLPYEKVAVSTAPASPPPSGTVPALPSAIYPPSPEEWAEQVKSAPAELHIGECLSVGWERFQSHMPLSIATVVLLVAAFVAVYLIPVLNLIVPVLIIGPVYAGLIYYFVRLVRSGEPDLAHGFAGFGSDFIPLMLAGILVHIIVAVCAIPGIIVVVGGVIASGVIGMSLAEAQQAMYSMSLSVLGSFLAGLLLTVLLAIFALVFFQFSLPLILDKKVDMMTALRLSFQRSSKRWFRLFLLMIVGVGMLCIGLVCCLVGALFTVPWFLAALAVAYEKLFPGETYVPRSR